MRQTHADVVGKAEARGRVGEHRVGRLPGTEGRILERWPGSPTKSSLSPASAVLASRSVAGSGPGAGQLHAVGRLAVGHRVAQQTARPPRGRIPPDVRRHGKTPTGPEPAAKRSHSRADRPGRLMDTHCRMVTSAAAKPTAKPRSVQARRDAARLLDGAQRRSPQGATWSKSPCTGAGRGAGSGRRTRADCGRRRAGERAGRRPPPGRRPRAGDGGIASPAPAAAPRGRDAPG